jgi:hypothetical protein
MQHEQRQLSPIEALRAYLAERKTWPQEKQDEEVEMLFTDKQAYMPRYRRIRWADSEDAKLAFCKQPSFGDCAYDPDLDPTTLEEAQLRVAGMIRRMEHETADQFRESYNGLVYLQGLDEGQLHVEELATPDPPEKIAKYF